VLAWAGAGWTRLLSPAAAAPSPATFKKSRRESFIVFSLVWFFVFNFDGKRKWVYFTLRHIIQ
jgi:hypothetical protein